MHRLKKWFGIQDFPVQDNGKDKVEAKNTPQNLSDKNENKSNNSLIQKSTFAGIDQHSAVSNNSNVDNTLVNVPLKPLLTHQKDVSYIDKIDLWLRRYVPLEPGECLSCKLTGSSVLLAFAMERIVSSYRKRKVLAKITIVQNLLASGVITSILVMRWNNDGIFKPKKPDETTRDFVKRILEEDKEDKKKMYENVKKYFKVDTGDKK